eukprot:jgi/Psemu1/35685/gm1.35685_g
MPNIPIAPDTPIAITHSYSSASIIPIKANRRPFDCAKHQFKPHTATHPTDSCFHHYPPTRNALQLRYNLRSTPDCCEPAVERLTTNLPSVHSSDSPSVLPFHIRRSSPTVDIFLRLILRSSTLLPPTPVISFLFLRSSIPPGSNSLCTFGGPLQSSVFFRSSVIP